MPGYTLQYYISILQEIDSLDSTVSDWEAEFIDSILHKAEADGFTLSPKQESVIDRMKERYLA